MRISSGRRLEVVLDVRHVDVEERLGVGEAAVARGRVRVGARREDEAVGRHDRAEVLRVREAEREGEARAPAGASQTRRDEVRLSIICSFSMLVTST